jgi:hypothetical protein
VGRHAAADGDAVHPVVADALARRPAESVGSHRNPATGPQATQRIGRKPAATPPPPPPRIQSGLGWPGEPPLPGGGLGWPGDIAPEDGQRPAGGETDRAGENRAGEDRAEEEEPGHPRPGLPPAGRRLGWRRLLRIDRVA